MHIDDPYGTDEDICMGYDNENVRGGQRRSRARQAGAPAGGRNIDYRVGEEPGKKEPGLDLITDHFSEQKTTGTAGSAKLTVRDSRNHMEVIEFTVTLGE